MTVYIKKPGGALLPRGSYPVTLLDGEQLVEIDDAAVRPYPTLERVILEWEHGTSPHRPAELPHYLQELARRIRKAFPEAGL